MGQSESNLCKILGSRRNEAIISTKCGLKWHKEDHKRAIISVDNSFSSLTEDVVSSLKRLKIDRIPILFIHREDPSTSLEESLDCLSELKNDGLIDKIGLSNHSLSNIQIASKQYKIDFCQVEINYINREHIETIQYCNSNNIDVISYSSLARGILTEKYLDGFRKFEDSDRRSRLDSFSEIAFLENSEKVRNLSKVANEYGYNIPSLALRWILDVLECSFSLTGFKTIDQFFDIEKALNNKLPKDLIDIMKEELSNKNLKSS